MTTKQWHPWTCTPTSRVLADNFGADVLALEQQYRSVSKDLCPKCGGELDTGWECNGCGFDTLTIISERQYVEVGPDLFEPFEGTVETKSGYGVNGLVWKDTGKPLTIDHVRNVVFSQVIDRCPHLTFILTTAYPERVRDAWPGKNNPSSNPHVAFHRSNVILLARVTTQAQADARVPEVLRLDDLCQCVGVEAVPRERIDLRPYLPKICSRCNGSKDDDDCNICAGLGWVSRYGIGWLRVRGEVGPDARPLHPQVVRELRDQAVGAGVPFWLWMHSRTDSDVYGRLLDGKTWEQMPDVKGGG